ncbi:hypothetical protein FA13DRAFT_1799043 [Coprinellus micaceus]|uniref:Uncharacterized protein n=1 Tax=Coprinellus micaceus TaxID=71717 RepID=A0A4Y7SK71_COPMI|nr:hypothetical protein FA13DRAFT_1799043 [Coprinellus micaceus]
MRLVVTPYGHPTCHVTSPGGVSTPNTHPLASRPYAQCPPLASRPYAQCPPLASHPYAQCPPLASHPYAQCPPRMSRLDAERTPRVSRPYTHPFVPRSYAERPPPDAMSHPLHHVPTANAHPSCHVPPPHATSHPLASRPTCLHHFLSPMPTPSRDTTTNTHAHAPCHIL